MFDTKQFNYEINAIDPAPQPGQYLVWFGRRKGILHVIHIKSVRKIKHRIVTDRQTYDLVGYKRPDLKELTEYEHHLDNTTEVYVRGIPALPCFFLDAIHNHEQS